ncbi:hypothetical protein PLICRDRAFT_175798 [Plicaturopsis crispa FD-325 SS-3]|nr:hypothetical protein PLICRDRAFT_175798 [Plicaturopsis crispa FD-325 SS-3]
MSRLPRIPRLTLFSGPNCSLCDTAKAELARVRQSRSFELETINIQDQGQEKWKKKYVYWIPALHLDGKEVAKGRWDASAVIQALDTWEKSDQDTDDDDIDGAYERRCFNCGASDHAVSACPTPRNSQLISLSRQLFEFYRTTPTSNPERIHVVEAWKQQRLDWLDEFDPGTLKGTLLREALDLSDGEHSGEWLRNIALWGYPRGWIGYKDPRERVYRRIAYEDADMHGPDDEQVEFLIFGDEGEEERVVLKPPLSDAQPVSDTSSDSDTTSASERSTSEAAPEPSESQAATTPPLRRWAEYPPTYFSSALLPVYNGYALPPLESDSFTSDRKALWGQIANVPFLPNAALPAAPPPPPPPPPGSPPPLPPSPGTPLLPPEPPQDGLAEDADDEVDMDMSD